MKENRVMTEAEMALAKATGARSVTIHPELRGFDPEMTQEEFEEYLNPTLKDQDPAFWLEVKAVRELQEKMSALVAPLNVSHALPLGWSLDDDLRIVKQLLDLKREQLVALEEAHYNLKRKIREMGFDPKELG